MQEEIFESLRRRKFLHRTWSTNCKRKSQYAGPNTENFCSWRDAFKKIKTQATHSEKYFKNICLTNALCAELPQLKIFLSKLHINKVILEAYVTGGMMGVWPAHGHRAWFLRPSELSWDLKEVCPGEAEAHWSQEHRTLDARACRAGQKLEKQLALAMGPQPLWDLAWWPWSV